MEILKTIQERRTVRDFKVNPLPDHVLDEILEAATWAPSHRNEQPWRFVLVGQEARGKLLSMFTAKVDELMAAGQIPEHAKPGFESLKEDFGGAPKLLAVISPKGQDGLHEQENLAAGAAAVQNMMLAAWSMGVGSVWLTVGSVPPAKPVLQVSENENVVALLALGYPDEEPTAPPREPHNERLTVVS